MRLTFEKALQKYEAFMTRCYFSEDTIEHKKLFYGVFSEWLSENHQEFYQDLRAIDTRILDDFLDFLVLKHLEPSTMRLYMSYLKVFFSYLLREDLITVDPTRKFVSLRIPKKEVDFISHAEVLKTLDEMFFKDVKRRDYNVAMRDYFMIRTAYVTGWRACESLACDPTEDIDWETGEIYLPKEKGGGDGYVYLDSETCRKLKEWYFFNYPNGKRLWYSMRGTKKGMPLTYDGYYQVFKKYFSKGPHRLRASFATYLFENDVDIKVIQELMRHESISSTMKYVARVRSKIKQVHQQKNPFSR